MMTPQVEICSDPDFRMTLPQRQQGDLEVQFDVERVQPSLGRDEVEQYKEPRVQETRVQETRECTRIRLSCGSGRRSTSKIMESVEAVYVVRAALLVHAFHWAIRIGWGLHQFIIKNRSSLVSLRDQKQPIKIVNTIYNYL